MSDKAYTTEEKLEAYLNATIITGAAADAILAAQEYIDKYTDRNFKADANASVRLYDGNDTQAIVIDDCVEVSKVDVGSDVWGDNFTEQTQYFKLPTNYTADKVPIRKIGLRSMVFIPGHANHRITAKWGYSAAVPSDIVQAATVLASGIYYQNRGENTGPIKSEKIGEYQVSYADDKGFNDVTMAMQTLERYKKIQL